MDITTVDSPDFAASYWLNRGNGPKFLFMSRFRFLIFGLAVALSFAASASSAQAPSGSSGSVSKPKRTFDEAITAIQSKEPHSGSSFRLIRELHSSATWREDATGKGILFGLMRSGGFVILEVDNKGDHAISLHLVSQTVSGNPLVESNPVEGEISASLAQELITESADLIDVLLSTRIDASSLESKFDGSHFPESHDPDEDEAENLFAVPAAIENVGAEDGEIRELAALLGSIDTWPIRYAISTRIFPADAPRAIEAGVREFVSLSRQFTHGKKESLDVLHLLQDLKSVRSAEQLRNRVSTLGPLDTFLEQKLVTPDASMTSAANRSIATIPLSIGFYGSTDGLYGVMTSSGIIVGWKVSSGGALVVKRMGLARD